MDANRDHEVCCNLIGQQFCQIWSCLRNHLATVFKHVAPPTGFAVYSPAGATRPRAVGLINQQTSWRCFNQYKQPLVLLTRNTPEVPFQIV